jgi:tetratricopeptide (TPR) repeat protein
MDHPNVPDFQRRLERVLISMSEVQTRLGLIEQRLAAYEEACELQIRLAEADPNQAELASRVGVTQHNRAMTLLELNRPMDAWPVAAAAVDWHRRALARRPDCLPYQRRLAANYALQAGVGRALGQYDAAIDAIHKILELWPSDRDELHRCVREFALTATVAKDRPETRARCIELAVATLRRAVAAGFRDVETVRNDAVLAPLQADPEFQAIVKQLSTKLK